MSGRVTMNIDGWDIEIVNEVDLAKVLLVRSSTFSGLLVRAVSMSVYSHAAFLIKGTVYESDFPQVVCCPEDEYEYEYDEYDIVGIDHDKTQLLESWCDRQVGKPYGALSAVQRAAMGAEVVNWSPETLAYRGKHQVCTDLIRCGLGYIGLPLCDDEALYPHDLASDDRLHCSNPTLPDRSAWKALRRTGKQARKLATHVLDEVSQLAETAGDGVTAVWKDVRKATKPVRKAIKKAGKRLRRMF